MSTTNTKQEMSAGNVTNNTEGQNAEGQNTKVESVNDVMKDLEYKVNPKSSLEGIERLATALKIDSIQPNKGSSSGSGYILQSMELGAEEFKQRMGRNMTYSEMRQMWG